MKCRNKYLDRTKKATMFLRWCPFIRLAGLNGSIVRGEDTMKSDIDFLIIAKKGRLYMARFFATFLVSLTGYRRHGKKIAGRICLNCYLSDQNPDISPKDPRSNFKVANAYKYLIPLVDAGNVANRFFDKNKWMNKYKQSAVSSQQSAVKYREELIQNYFKKFPIKPKHFGEKLLSGKLGDWLEKKLMDYQTKRIMSGFKKGDETVATRDEIRLHPKKI